jgi:hypothetical protein
MTGCTDDECFFGDAGLGFSMLEGLPVMEVSLTDLKTRPDVRLRLMTAVRAPVMRTMA